jgi:superoxide dismutase/chemotaxis methyl-accepting protein methylase
MQRPNAGNGPKGEGATMDAECVAFLQWALPQLGLRWAGFRKVRRTTCKRLRRRLTALGLPGLAAYRAFLGEHASEWAVLDASCRIPISRFFRDRAVFERIGRELLPELAARAIAEGRRELRCWSCGCASGEEPYSIAILWQLRLKDAFPDLQLRIVATDVDGHLLDRARRASYAAGSLRALVSEWRDAAFVQAGGTYRLGDRFRADVELLEQDLRSTMPDGPFDLVLCRNLVFTYFDEPTQRAVLHRLFDRIRPGGALVIGSHESISDERFARVSPCIYRRTSAGALVDNFATVPSLLPGAAPMTRYVLPDLPYDYAALEPHLSARIMQLHHDKHHRAYVDGANQAIEQLVEARRRQDFAQIAALERRLAFHVSGHILHSIYWKNLSPNGGGRPDGKLAAAITRDFGSFENLKAQLVNTALTIMGSGWSALVWDPVSRRLGTTQIHDHQSEVTQGGIPLLVIDAWEHAYYLQYQTEKARYFEALWNLWSWPDVALRFEAAQRLDLVLGEAASQIPGELHA